MRRDSAIRTLRALAACMLAAPLIASAEPVPEYDLKAAFIYNFGLFTEWPPTASFEDGAVNICASASNPLWPALSALSEKRIKGRRVALRTPGAGEGVQGCHVLVLGAGDRARWVAWLREVRRSPVLTVADDRDGGYDGAILSISLDGGRIVFDINTRAAERAQLRLSSKLLRLGRMVQ